MADSDTIERTEHVVTPQLQEPGDSEKFAHYADKDKITEAYMTGKPIMALCGKFWVPTRDPSKFPVCPECKELFEMGPAARMRLWQEQHGGK